MATSSGNKLIPIFAAVAVLIVGVVMVKQCSSTPQAVKPGEALTQVPSPEKPLPEAKGADGDTPTETLATVVASNKELREQVRQVIEENRRLRAENSRLERGGGGVAALPPARDETPSARSSRATQDAIDELAPGASPLPEPEEVREPEEKSALDSAFDTVAGVLDSLAPTIPAARPQPRPQQQQEESGGGGVLSGVFGTAPAGPPPGRVSYQTMAPMGYAVMSSGDNDNSGVVLTRYVRTTVPSDPNAGGGSGGAATQAAQAAQQDEDTPYFTIPENATLVGATGMTALIGRVPIDGSVTDPLQFKAVIGRDNLAANGFELPPDIEGMIVSGVAIGDMALSCTEGKVRSLTFVFNDGTIRTVSSGNKKGGISVGDSGSNDLGYISDSWGNPCIAGKFVTNAPRYLTDIVGLSALGVAGQAYADAQRTTYTGTDGTQSSITGDVGHYALGQAVAGATNEVQRWMLSRLKNSFDAVIVPAGKQMVVHIDKEIWLDKAVNGRRLVHRRQKTIAQGGQRYGLQ